MNLDNDAPDNAAADSDAHDNADNADITRRTLDYYDRHAQQFFHGTIEHDVSQNLNALLDAIDGPAPHTILDLGCGPGRDLKALAAMGHRAIGIDGSTQFVDMIRVRVGDILILISQ